ncbi:MAG: hypothetical protein GX885_07990 [Methanomicrobiales archaeon]|nr:hypothetical protein [Methanomicrobiales archaeon]
MTENYIVILLRMPGCKAPPQAQGVRPDAIPPRTAPAVSPGRDRTDSRRMVLMVIGPILGRDTGRTALQHGRLLLE